MAWIKRNLYFLIGSLIALGLMGYGGYVLYSQMADESSVASDLAKQYEELKRLNNQNPHPGVGAVDNIKAAREQEATLRAYIEKTRPYFQRITPIPDPAAGKITDRDFAAQLRNTVSQLRRSAEQQSVKLPPDYFFTFRSQSIIMNFDPASLDSLAVHLGEIKAICDVMFDAKVNSLDSIKREIISVTNDKNPEDYLTQTTTSTPLADLTPYEIKFKCFSTELAQVMSQFANSRNGFLTKTINVEPTPPEVEDLQPGMTPGTQYPTTPRYYQGEGRGRGDYRQRAMSVAPQPVAAAPVPRGPQPFLNERLFRVTLMVQVIKLKPPTK